MLSSEISKTRIDRILVLEHKRAMAASTEDNPFVTDIKEHTNTILTRFEAENNSLKYTDNPFPVFLLAHYKPIINILMGNCVAEEFTSFSNDFMSQLSNVGTNVSKSMNYSDTITPNHNGRSSPIEFESNTIDYVQHSGCFLFKGIEQDMKVGPKDDLHNNAHPDTITSIRDDKSSPIKFE